MTPYYEDGVVTIYHGDCREVLPTLPAVDLVLTDPPYNCINRATGGLRVIDKGGADSRPVDIAEVADEFIRLATGSIYVWCGASFLSDWLRCFEDAGLTVRGGVWWKPNPSPMNGDKLWLSALEFCAFARKSKAYFDAFCKPAVWQWPVEEGDHPTPKPVRLVVLRLAHDNVWVQVTAIYAPTRRAAVNEATKGEANPYPFGTFRAVPVGAWGRPIIVSDWEPQETC